MKNSSFEKGFTLIEILVVIMIIGILAAIVMLALWNARIRAQDAKIKAEVAEMAREIQVYYNNNDYSFSGYSIPAVMVAPCERTYRVEAATDAYVIYSQLCSNPSVYWCTDATGAALEVNGEPDPAGYSCGNLLAP